MCVAARSFMQCSTAAKPGKLRGEEEGQDPRALEAQDASRCEVLGRGQGAEVWVPFPYSENLKIVFVA